MLQEIGVLERYVGDERASSPIGLSACPNKEVHCKLGALELEEEEDQRPLRPSVGTPPPPSSHYRGTLSCYERLGFSRETSAMSVLIAPIDLGACPDEEVHSKLGALELEEEEGVKTNEICISPQ